MVQLLLGNIGVAGGGMNALRGHSNIQGLTDVGLLSNAMPGYLTLARDGNVTFDDYMKTRLFKPMRPGQVSYWQNYRKFFVSFQKAMYGKAATAENDWAYDWLPKLDIPLYDIIAAFEMMDKGEINGYICQGFNPLQAFPDKGKIRRSLGKLKYLVVMDPLDTETSRFWENFGPQILPTPRAFRRKCSSFRPPALPRRTGRSSIRRAGCNGTGRPRLRRATPRATFSSWPASSIACARCTARTAAPSPIRSSTSRGITSIRSTLIPRKWPRK